MSHGLIKKKICTDVPRYRKQPTFFFFLRSALVTTSSSEDIWLFSG